MATIRMKQSNPLAAAGALAQLEESIGVALPGGYRRFLETSNGGRPDEYEVHVADWGITPLMRLFGLGMDGRGSLEFQVTRMKSLLPLGFIPIGDDPGGNFFCLGTRPGREGVYLWDHESSPLGDEEENEPVLFLVASSFEEFVDKCRPIRSEEEP